MATYVPNDWVLVGHMATDTTRSQMEMVARGAITAVIAAAFMLCTPLTIVGENRRPDLGRSIDEAPAMRRLSYLL